MHTVLAGIIQKEKGVQGSRKQGVHLEKESTLNVDSSLRFTFSRERILGPGGDREEFL